MGRWGGTGDVIAERVCVASLGRADYRLAARDILQSAGQLMQQAPTAAGQLLLALDLELGPFYQMVVVPGHDADDLRTALGELNRRYVPRTVLAVRSIDQAAKLEQSPLASLFRDRPDIGDATTIYVCEETHCWPPVAGSSAIAALADRLQGTATNPQV